MHDCHLDGIVLEQQVVVLDRPRGFEHVELHAIVCKESGILVGNSKVVPIAGASGNIQFVRWWRFHKIERDCKTDQSDQQGRPVGLEELTPPSSQFIDQPRSGWRVFSILGRHVSDPFSKRSQSG